ncbi:hypothetical protein APS56_11680 [Pseudalgibacter alginicilyticus]|uniref:Uncharacterized protein n=1 Tax=Pseudalgibacter alginicilyticus TaxID=1736674 RepID=A0A0P0CHU1_9FLAO|nr:hypothetical protein [Pseudalgibacter alginicilyticus]ALJ05744.1 hypothetical protein APS56_11680 [Pseudalgibacter alginicilyticus]
MKKITFTKSFSFIVALICGIHFGLGQEIASFSSVQNSACSGVISNDPNISATGICRGPGITETNTGIPSTKYNSNNWTTGNSPETDDYLEWTLTPMLDIKLL